jgi:hypothetical protein
LISASCVESDDVDDGGGGGDWLCVFSASALNLIAFVRHFYSNGVLGPPFHSSQLS